MKEAFMVDDFNDFLLDAQLGIETTGRNDTHSDTFRYPYEPTSYAVMDRIIEEYIGADDYLVDYGCGMGRVPIYMNYRTGCRSIGIEMVEDFYNSACDNLRRYSDKLSTLASGGAPAGPGYSKRADASLIAFEQALAEKWELPAGVNCLFFFNPFSVKIMRGVMGRILDSYYDSPRNIRLFFYYPQDEYMGYFATVEELDFADEIDCTDLFKQQDSRNRVMVFEIG